MNYILFDDEAWSELLPLTFTRPVAEVRVGILTIREKWERSLESSCSMWTQNYLKSKYPTLKDHENVMINGSVLPDEQLLTGVRELSCGEALCCDNLLIAVNLSEDMLEQFSPENRDPYHIKEYGGELIRIAKSYDVFARNDIALRSDFELITKGRTSQPVSETVNVLGSENIFIEEGACVEFATLNASNGPIYIGTDSQVMEGALIRGPFAMGHNSVVRMGARVYGATTLGPCCKLGGEVENVVLFGYSNKAHDGYLGNAVIGEWCNIGADTNNSNLKNNYSQVRIWNYPSERFEKTGMQFCGLVMGDHSKCGINTMLNTGTVIGVSSNVYGPGYPRNFIPSYVIGGSHGFKEYQMKRGFEVAQLVMNRRDKDFDEVEQNILSTVFELTQKYRTFL